MLGNNAINYVPTFKSVPYIIWATFYRQIRLFTKCVNKFWADITIAVYKIQKTQRGKGNLILHFNIIKATNWCISIHSFSILQFLFKIFIV